MLTYENSLKELVVYYQNRAAIRAEIAAEYVKYPERASNFMLSAVLYQDLSAKDYYMAQTILITIGEWISNYENID